jgi:hypothetical protein
LALTLLYLPLLSPSSISTDATWFHLSAAEEYAREGSLVPFYGDWAKCIPQLTTLLHMHAFLVPGLQEPLRWVLALHTEFVLFLFTLHGVGVLTRYLMRGQPAHLAWVVFFLFPAIYIYDSNLGGTADHVSAFFCVPHVLYAFKFLEKPRRKLALLAGVFAGGALFTKLQAAYLIVPLLLTHGVSWLIVSARKRRIDWQRCLNVALYLAGCGAIFLPHLLKNWVYYKNPMYPFFMDYFASYPEVVDAPQLFREHYPPFDHGPLWPHFLASLKLTARHHLDLLDTFHTHKPFIGALFTLTTPILLVWRNRRIWIASGVAWSAMFLFVFAFPSPRNMQSFLPLMVAVTAACLARAWSSGIFGRLATCVLVTGQIVSGADLIATAERRFWDDVQRLVQTGTVAAKNARYESYRRPFRDVRNYVPEDGVVLLHTAYSQLGIQRKTLLDWPGFQGLIDYRPARTPRDLYEILAGHGITHLVVEPRWSAHARQEQILFDALLKRHSRRLGVSGVLHIYKMPEQAPPSEPSYQAFLWGAPRQSDGLYRIELLDQLDDGPVLERVPERPLNAENAQELVLQADGLIIGAHIQLPPEVLKTIQETFERTSSFSHSATYLRKKPRLSSKGKPGSAR